MKAAEIIHKKLPRFTKPRFFYIYEQLLYSTIRDIEKPSKVKKIKKKVFSIKEPFISYWPNIIHALKEKDSHFYSQYCYSSILVTSYIKLHIKRNIIPKLLPVSFLLKRSIEYIIRIHLKLCKHEMENKHLPTYNPMDSIAYADEEEEELRRKNNIVNLFIGDFDLKKFLENEQKIKMKQGEYCNTFIFANYKNDNNNNKQKKNVLPFGKLFSHRKHNAFRKKHPLYMQTKPKLYCPTSRIGNTIDHLNHIQYNTINTTSNTKSNWKYSCNKKESLNAVNSKENVRKDMKSEERNDKNKENVNKEFETIVPNRRNYHSHQNSEELRLYFKEYNNNKIKKLKPLLSNSNSNYCNTSNSNNYYLPKCKTQSGILYTNGSINARNRHLIVSQKEKMGCLSNRVIFPYKGKTIMKTENFITKKDLYY